MKQVALALMAGTLLACNSGERPTAKPSLSPTPSVTITNGERYTVDGKRIDAHSGTMLYANGYYFLYGEAYACGFRWTDPSTPYCGAQVYRSRDLTAWSGPWPLFDASAPYWQQLCMHTPGLDGAGCFRPKVVYNAATKLYVLWINTPDQAGFRALTSPTPLGPFAVASTPDLNDSGITGWDGKATNPGDEDVFVDRDGSGWLTYNRGGTLLIRKLTRDYLNSIGPPLVPGGYPDLLPHHGVEAPAMFRVGGTYYLSLSMPRCPYCPATGTGLMTATSPAGPWTYVGLISEDSCGGQPNGVAVLPGGVYLYSSDQWRQGEGFGTFPQLNETNANQFWAPLAISDGKILPIICP